MNILIVHHVFSLDACDDISCSAWKDCMIRDDGLPTCQCKPIEAGDWESGFVCTSSGDTYPSIAILKLFACAHDSMFTIEHNGKCKEEKGERYAVKAVMQIVNLVYTNRKAVHSSKDLSI